MFAGAAYRTLPVIRQLLKPCALLSPALSVFFINVINISAIYGTATYPQVLPC
jgi:hypothetical protein